MEKSEILELLLEIKQIGCCNMFDRNCIYQALKEADEHEAAEYLENLTSKAFISFLSKDFSDYLQTSSRTKGSKLR